MSCKYRQDTKAANGLFTDILEVYEVSSNRILGSCQAGMQCCGQAALCPQCSQLSLGCVVYPQFFQQPCERSVSVSLSLLYPHDLWTDVPVAGTRSKSRGALWDRFVLQMGKRDTLWYKVKSYGRNSYSEGRSLSRKICTLTYGRDQSAVAPYQADKSWRHKSAENQIALAEMLKTSLHF